MDNELKTKKDASSDRDFNLKLLEIINYAVQKGYTKTFVINSFSQKWSEIINAQNDKLVKLTDKEKEFFEKVDKFYSDFGQAFVLRESWRDSSFDWNKREEIETRAQKSFYINRLLAKLKVSTKSMYYIYSRGGAFTKKSIKNYNKKLFGFSKGIDNIYTINRALGDLFIVGSKIIYVIDEKERTNYLGNRIIYNENYLKFVKSRSYRNTELTSLSLKLIWIISNYI